MRTKRTAAASVTAFAFLGAFVILITKFIGSGDRSMEIPKIAGPTWSDIGVTTSTAQNPSRIYFVTEEERQFQERVGSSRRAASYRTINYTRYRIRSREAATGELIGDVVVADVRNARSNGAPEIVGPVPGGLWVYRNGIELRNPDTLAVVATSETLRQMNPEVANTLSGRREDYRICAIHNALLVKTNDLMYYSVDATGKFSPADRNRMQEITGKKTQAEAFRYLPASGRSRGTTSVNDFLVSSFLTSTGQWYGLISEDKLQGLGRWPRAGDKPYGEEWRQLYNVAYTVDDRNQPEIDPAAVNQVGKARFLNGAFLQRTDIKVWDVADPSSTLVLHKKNLDRNTPWSLARLTRTGEVLFDESTGLADLHTVTDAGDSLVLYGFKDFNEPTYDRPHLLVFVDPSTGRLVEKNESFVPEDDK